MSDPMLIKLRTLKDELLTEREKRLDAEAQLAAIKDAAENTVIAFGMGWDLDGVIDVLRAALASAAPGETT